MLCDINLKAISRQIPKLLFCVIRWKNYTFKIIDTTPSGQRVNATHHKLGSHDWNTAKVFFIFIIILFFMSSVCGLVFDT